MRLFRSAVLIIMRGVVGCQTAAGPRVRLPAYYPRRPWRASRLGSAIMLPVWVIVHVADWRRFTS